MQIVLSLTNSSEWKALDYLSFESKINYLNKFAKEKMQELVSAFDTEKQSNTYAQIISLKVLDNLQINFSNIHIRIEDNSLNPPISFGFTLQKLNVINCDENWEQVFIDKSKDENQNTELFKLLQISNFGFFLNLNDKVNLGKYEDHNFINEEMNKMFSHGSEKVKGYDYLIKPGKILYYMKWNYLKCAKLNLFFSLFLIKFKIKFKK